MLILASSPRPWYTSPHLARLILYPLALVASACARWWQKRKERKALVWPLVEGCIQSGQITCFARNGTSCSVTLEYSYYTGEYRSGEYSEVFDSENDATDFIRGMKGGKVTIHYNPSKPDDSVLEPADVEHLWITSPLDPMIGPAKLR